MKKKNKAPWQILKEKGWKTYNDGINNKMFPDTKSAKEAGYIYDGFAIRNQTTHFHYCDLKNRRNK